MSQNPNSAVAVIGIDIGKNSFHVVGQDTCGAILLRQKWSRCPACGSSRLVPERGMPGRRARQAARRMPQRRNVLQPEGSHRRRRAMAQSIQHDPAALIALSAASTPNIHSPIASAGSELPDCNNLHSAGPKYPSGHAD